MLIPMGILAIITLIIGLFPQNALLFILAPVAMFVPVTQMLTSLAEITTVISLLFFVFLVIVIAVCVARIILNNGKRVHTTWGCGYNKPNNRMQYTASSYADLFISTLKPMFKRVEHIKKPKELFPKEAYYDVEIEDIEEAYIVKPLIKLDEKILSGAVILQSSLDGESWITDSSFYDIADAESEFAGDFYTTKDIQQVNGCYYRVIVVYEVEKQIEDKKIAFVFHSHPTKDLKMRWQAVVAFPPGATAETPLAISVVDGEGEKVASAIFEFAGCELPVVDGAATMTFASSTPAVTRALTYMSFVHQLMLFVETESPAFSPRTLM